eukprot:607349-Hanusia_phi.AAC.1
MRRRCLQHQIMAFDYLRRLQLDRRCHESGLQRTPFDITFCTRDWRHAEPRPRRGRTGQVRDMKRALDMSSSSKLEILPSILNRFHCVQDYQRTEGAWISLEQLLKTEGLNEETQ